MRSSFAVPALVLALALTAAQCRGGDVDAEALQLAYRAEVTPRLAVPPAEAQRYGILLLEALDGTAESFREPQYVALVDRNPYVQAVLLFRVADGSPPVLVGASPVSTGRPGSFDHFMTPLGVFAHSPANPDFRAEGTRNANGIRGYGVKGMRIFDLGWQSAERLWGAGGVGTMRLQMHATDPDVLEARLGTVQSKGCVRIPASLDRFLDHYGVLDADYLAARVPSWVLPADQRPVAEAGRFIVVVDSNRAHRPAWSPSASHGER